MMDVEKAKQLAFGEREIRKVVAYEDGWIFWVCPTRLGDGAKLIDKEGNETVIPSYELGNVLVPVARHHEISLEEAYARYPELEDVE